MKNLMGMMVAALLLSGAVVKAEQVDQVAALVNRNVITLSEVEKHAAPMLAHVVQHELDPAKRAELRTHIIKGSLDALIDEKLLEEQIQELGLGVTDAELEVAIADERRRSQSDEVLLVTRGYKDLLRKQLARRKLVQMRVKVKVPEAHLRAAYTQYKLDSQVVHARHLLVQLGPIASAEKVEAARKKAEALAAEARKPGVDFAALAKAKSEDPSAADGGDLGFFTRGAGAPFARVAFSLNEGEVSEPVRTKSGWHILKAEQKRAADVAPFAQVKGELEAELKLKKYVQELRQKASVEVKM